MRILLFLLILPVIAQAQFADDFNDGNFTQPLWLGDTAAFTVVNGELQLTSSGSATSHLTYNRIPAGNQEHEWSFHLRLTFSPSSQNYARYYLYTDSLYPSNASNALYLQAGETGSNDAPELLLRTNGNVSTLARGIDGSIATASNLQYTLQCDSNYYWSLWTKDATGNSILQFVIQYPLTQNAGYAGIQCTYTSSNADNFYLDDVYDGAIRYDSLPPQIKTAFAISSDSVLITWNEPVNSSNASFEINNIACAAPTLTSAAQVTLYFANGFSSGAINNLRTYNVNDLHNNINPEDSITFQYILAIPAIPGQLRINELMPDPGNANQLPEAEYIELVNITNQYLLLDSLVISDGTSNGMIRNDTLAPFGFRTYSSTTGATLLKHTGLNAIGISSFPSLNNDGDTIRLLHPDGTLLDEVGYTTSSYQNAVKSSGGWSLERIDADYPCESDGNWKASNDFSGGTPGRKNSVAGIYSDETPPCLLYAWMADSMHLQLHFSETMDPFGAHTTTNFTLSPASLQITSAALLNATTVLLGLSGSVDNTLQLIITADPKLTDCSGNTIGSCNSANTGIGHSPKTGEIILNEILFNPFPDGEDFIEILNRSATIISLDSIRLGRKDESGAISDYTLLHAQGRCIFPGEILAISTNPDILKKIYPTTELHQVLAHEIPPMNDDAGTVCVFDPAMNVVDEFTYREEMQYALLASVEGVSLERISSDAGTADSTNWHSAASSCGYATPGYRNSQSAEWKSDDALLDLPYVLFSPDNDGNKDALPIQLHFDRNGYRVKLALYSAEGRMVRELSGNELAGLTSTWFWDGTDESRNLCTPGIYIVLAEVIHPAGIRKIAKKACVLARQF